MEDIRLCPICDEECMRVEVDIGVGIQYGPWGCACGWSENEYYDSSKGDSKAEQENPKYLFSSTGAMISKASLNERLNHFGIEDIF